MVKYILVALSLTFVAGLRAQTTTIFLVRHAEKVDNSRDPELNLAGKARAIRLMELLKDAEIDAIYSTNYIRTKKTVEPLAEKIGKEIEIYRPFDEGFRNSVKGMTDKTILVSGHSNTIPDFVNFLIDQKKFDQLDDSEYAKVFVVTVSDGNPNCIVLNF